ncbi:MAG: DMT family transporter [Chloroflexi bacterium]|nr:DMT family transporter [Chloroflexota bacterium]
MYPHLKRPIALGSPLAANLMLLTAAFAWGATFVFIKSALGQIGPFTFLAFRFWIAFAVLAIFLRKRLRQGGCHLWRDGAILGGILCAAYAFQTIGLRSTTATRAGFVTGLFVVIVPLLSAFLLRQMPPPSAWLAVFLAVSGLALISLPIDPSLAPGDGLMLLCALMVAVHILLVGQQAHRHDPLALGTVQIGTMALFSGVGAVLTEPLPVTLSFTTWIAILFTALPATALAVPLQMVAQRRVTPHQAALLLTLEPVFAALTAYLFLDERLDERGLTGCGLILTAMLAAKAPLFFNAHRSKSYLTDKEITK